MQTEANKYETLTHTIRKQKKRKKRQENNITIQEEDN